MTAGEMLETSRSQVAQHILRVAARLFAARGYDATPVRMVVEEAGVTKPTLYYHFGSKEGLANALLTQPMARLVRTLGEILDRDEPVEELLAEYIQAHFAFCQEEPDRARLMYAIFFGPLATGVKAELREFVKTIECHKNLAAERTLRSGRIREADLKRFHAALHGQITVYTLDYLYKNVNLDPGLAHQIVRDLFQGFDARRGDVGPAASEDQR